MNIPGQVLALVAGERKPVAVSDAQRLFLETYPRFGTIAGACQALGMDPGTVYSWQREEPEESPFVRAWQVAKEIGCDYILQDMIDATKTQPATMPSQVARMFLIKAQRPEYRDQLTVKSTSINLTARVDLNQLDTSERLELLQLTKRRMELLTQQGGNVADGSPDVGDGGG